MPARATELFHMMAEAELVELAEDIEAHGLQFPIIVHEGRVLDGRNRLKACEFAGVEPKFSEWEANGATPAEWIIGANLHRRHLTISQRAAIAVEALPILKAEAKERMLAGKKPNPRAQGPQGWSLNRYCG